MRWKAHKDHRAGGPPLETLMVVIAAPFFFIVVGAFLIDELLRERMGHSAGWEPWYAWHPVRATNHAIDARSETTVWLETIWRRTRQDRVEYATELQFPDS